MSDRDAIFEALARVSARIRANLLIERAATGLWIFMAVAVFAAILNLLVPLGTALQNWFWPVWLIGLVAFLLTTLRVSPSLSEAAADVDRKAHLKDEVVSAHWFLSHNITNPWIDLQVRRAAENVKRLDIRSLYPWLVPRSSYLAAAGLVLLVSLNWVPSAPGDAEPIVAAPLTDDTLPGGTDELFNQIEELLAEAERLQPSPVIDDFQELLESMEASATPADEAELQMLAIERRIDEGNLDIASLLDGLEEIGEDLSRSGDTQAAGEALMDGNPATAAGEFDDLAEGFSSGQEPETDLADALAAASENRGPGLEELADNLQIASADIEGGNLDGAEQALTQSAGSLRQLSDAIESQRLQNEAAERMDALEEALRQQQIERISDLSVDEDPDAERPQGTLPTTTATEGVPMESDAAQPGMEGMAGMGLETPAEGEAMSEETAPGGQQPGQSPDAFSSDMSGMIPAGYGFSPEIREGAPTSLEVQLYEEFVAGQVADPSESGDEDGPNDLATRREESFLDYRDIPSELTPAQQQLLNQDRIPREYQNLIREYFEVIRPRTDNQSEDTDSQP